MLKIYHAPGTRGFRTIWCCEELGVPYQAVATSMDKDFRFSDEWRKMVPTGKVPAMTDGEFKLYESCAMTQYVIDKYGNGKLQPTAGTAASGEYQQWCWYAESTFSRPVGEVVNHNRSFGEKAIDSVIDEMTGRAVLAAECLDGEIAGKTYLLGDEFSGADIMMGWTLSAFCRVLQRELPGENLSAYWARLQTRVAYKAAVAVEKSLA